MEIDEDEDEHSAFVMSLSRLAAKLAQHSETPMRVDTPAGS
jgi:hypothetical protein